MASGPSSAPAGVDLGEDKRPAMIAASVTTWILAFANVIVRITGRKIKALNLWLDDWFIVAAPVRYSQVIPSPTPNTHRHLRLVLSRRLS